jgi:integrase/recombinase XerD
MNGDEVSFPFIKPNNHIPYYFDEEDVAKIFGACCNLKHLAMLHTLFYGCLRASELCELDDMDLDLKRLTIRVLEGKGGKEGVVYIASGCAKILKQYMDVRPLMDIGGRQPLFYTDFGLRWERKSLHRMFMSYKKLAGIEKHGGVHVFSRHSPASLMVKNGCDIVTIKELLRHSDVRTTLRYAHISDKTRREKYEQYLAL